MADTDPVPALAAQRKLRMKQEIIHPVSTFTNELTERLASAQAEIGTLDFQINALQEARLSQQRIVEACEAGLHALKGNGEVTV